MKWPVTTLKNLKFILLITFLSKPHFVLSQDGDYGDGFFEGDVGARSTVSICKSRVCGFTPPPAEITFIDAPNYLLPNDKLAAEVAKAITLLEKPGNRSSGEISAARKVLIKVIENIYDLENLVINKFKEVGIVYQKANVVKLENGTSDSTPESLPNGLLNLNSLDSPVEGMLVTAGIFTQQTPLTPDQKPTDALKIVKYNLFEPVSLFLNQLYKFKPDLNKEKKFSNPAAFVIFLNKLLHISENKSLRQLSASCKK